MNVTMGDVPIAEMESIYYVWWPLATIVTIALMSFLSFLVTLVVVFLKRLLVKFDAFGESIQEMQVENGIHKTQLAGHIQNAGIHCKQGDCARRPTNAATA